MVAISIKSSLQCTKLLKVFFSQQSTPMNLKSKIGVFIPTGVVHLLGTDAYANWSKTTIHSYKPSQPFPSVTFNMLLLPFHTLETQPMILKQLPSRKSFLNSPGAYIWKSPPHLTKSLSLLQRDSSKLQESGLIPPYQCYTKAIWQIKSTQQPSNTWPYDILISQS